MALIRFCHRRRGAGVRRLLKETLGLMARAHLARRRGVSYSY
jgi:hypothetical protein